MGKTDTVDIGVVGIGVIGVGNMGSAHAKSLHKGEVPGARLAAVCDIDPEKLRLAREVFGDAVAYFDSPDALLASGTVQAVLVATPHYDHPPLAIEAFKKGLHVLIEKPAGVYTKQVRDMNEAAEASNRVFGIMFNQRAQPAHAKLRELLQSGEVGEIRRIQWVVTTWFRPQSYYNSGGWRATWAGEGGGVLLNQCPHNLDLWQWFCGMPRRVRGFCHYGKYHDVEIEDDVTAYMEYENGATGVFITSTGEGAGSNRLEVIGDHGRLVMEHDTLRFHRTRGSVAAFTKEHQGGFGTPEVWSCEIPVASGHIQQHVAILRNFTDAIRNGTPLLAPGIEGINSLEISNALHLSSWLDTWVDLPVDADLYYEQLQERIRTSRYVKPESAGKLLSVDGTF